MVEPISSTLAGIALVQKSVEFIKSNINTVNDIAKSLAHWTVVCRRETGSKRKIRR